MYVKIIKLFYLLHQADKSIAFSHYKMNIYEDTNTEEIVTSLNTIIEHPEDVPTSITAMLQLFFVSIPVLLYYRGGLQKIIPT